MVRSEGHDPSLTRTLQEAAHSLSGLNAVHSPSLGPLLPETTKMECGTVFVDLQAVRVSAGSLVSMNRGESVSSPMTMQDNNTAHTKDRKTQSTYAYSVIFSVLVSHVIPHAAEVIAAFLLLV